MECRPQRSGLPRERFRSSTHRSHAFALERTTNAEAFIGEPRNFLLGARQNLVAAAKCRSSPANVSASFREVREELGRHALRDRALGHRRRDRFEKRKNYLAGNTASTPFFFSRTTTNFAGFVVLALRPTVCTSLGPS